MLLLSVKVQVPAEALGMEVAPVETVISPELERVPEIVRFLVPQAKVCPAGRIRFVALVVPVSVPP